MAVWSETKLSKITESFGRFDPEFYRPEFLESDRVLSSLDTLPLRRVASKIDVGHVGPMVRHYSDNGVLLLQTQNVRDFFIDLTHSIRITTSFHSILAKSQIQTGDILIARSGSFGAAAIYLDDDFINSADIIIVRIDNPTIDPLYAVTFMNSRYGSAQLLRFASGGVQGHINLRILEHFRIPVVHGDDQQAVASFVQEANTHRRSSQAAYEEADNIIAAELGLDRLAFDQRAGYRTTLSEAVVGNRIDGEYFQPKYQALRDAIKSYTHGFELIIQVADALKPNIDPSQAPASDFNYVELSQINSALGMIEGHTESSGAGLPSRARRQVSAGDVIASAVVGSVDKVAIISPDEDGYLASTGFFHFRPKTVSPEYLLMLVRSRCVSMQFQQQATGGILSAVPDGRLKYVIVPRFPQKLQDKVTDLVAQAHQAKRESDALLEQAKARVEQLIEEAIEP